MSLMKERWRLFRAASSADRELELLVDEMALVAGSMFNGSWVKVSTDSMVEQDVFIQTMADGTR